MRLKILVRNETHCETDYNKLWTQVLKSFVKLCVQDWFLVTQMGIWPLLYNAQHIVLENSVSFVSPQITKSPDVSRIHEVQAPPTLSEYG